MAENTWDTRNITTGRHRRNGHCLELQSLSCVWKCLVCSIEFDIATEADVVECVPEGKGS